jgi:hypothetical protein
MSKHTTRKENTSFFLKKKTVVKFGRMKECSSNVAIAEGDREMISKFLTTQVW